MCVCVCRQALVLSQGTQMALSGMEDRGVGLPPASPSENEDHLDTVSCAVHLHWLCITCDADFSLNFRLPPLNTIVHCACFKGGI